MDLIRRTKEAFMIAIKRAGRMANLAEKTGVDYAAINRFKSGKNDFKNMTLQTFEKLFPELEISFFRGAPRFGTAEADQRMLKINENLSDEEKMILASCVVSELLYSHNLKCLYKGGPGLPATEADEYMRLIMSKVAELDVYQRIYLLAEIEKVKRNCNKEEQ